MGARVVDERGIALVLYTIAMLPMLGMLALVTDMGIEFARKTQMQAAVDSAVLAAAPLLGTNNAASLTEARTRAKALAAANGYPLADADIVISTTASANDTITITRSQTDNLIFARALGINQATAGVRAKAQVGVVSGGSGIVPFAIDEGPLVYGETYCLKADANGPCSGIALQGNFHAVNIDLADNGATPYKDDIINGSDTLVKIGDTRAVNQGNNAGPTRQGVGCDGHEGRLEGNTQTFSDVFALRADGSYDILDRDSPRIILVPVVTYPDPQHVHIEAFAGFFLENCSGNGNAASVTGKFVKMVYSGTDTEWMPLGDSDTDYGTRKARLMS
jgi:Flp pilus assembly protein TadG